MCWAASHPNTATAFSSYSWEQPLLFRMKMSVFCFEPPVCQTIIPSPYNFAAFATMLCIWRLCNLCIFFTKCRCAFLMEQVQWMHFCRLVVIRRARTGNFEPKAYFVWCLFHNCMGQNNFHFGVLWFCALRLWWKMHSVWKWFYENGIIWKLLDTCRSRKK